MVEALDSPHTSKGCIMRSSLMSLFFLNQVRLHSLLTAGAANVLCATECLVLLSPTQGAILDFSGWSSGGASYG